MSRGCCLAAIVAIAASLASSALADTGSNIHGGGYLDAAYVALAEALGIPLLTNDVRLAAATRTHTDVEVLTAWQADGHDAC